MPAARNATRTLSWYLSRTLLGLLTLAAAAALLVAAVGLLAGGPGSATTPAGFKRNQARHLVMRDGVRIAVDLWFPAGLSTELKIPTLISSTRYVRTMEYGILGRAMAAIGKLPWIDREVDRLTQNGYVVVQVDARGSGASFGTRPAEWSPDEVADMGDIVDWIVTQPWSNGRVGGWGTSYDGNTAELLAATGRPAVKAVAPLFDDYDPSFTQSMYGGAFGKPFIEAWGGGNNALDRNELCPAEASRLSCFLQRLVVKGIKPVDGDSGAALLVAAVAEHRGNYDVAEFVASMGSPRDSALPDGRPMKMVPPYAPQIRAAAEANQVAMLIRLGWFDGGTVNPGLGRFFTQTNPMRIEIGAWSHGGGRNTDPFAPTDLPPIPTSAEQWQAMLEFFDTYLKGDGTPAVGRLIRYYTMNDGTWKTTTVWPPADMQTTRWYFAGDQALTPEPPTADSAADVYPVDFTTTTGKPTRWHAQLGGFDAIYPDRAEADRKLLVYTGTPIATDIEITGTPVVNLEVSSTATDGLLIAYLEAVAPDGRVTYLTEGLLRARHRKLSTEPPPYHEFGPVHSFTSVDAEPMVPGVATTVSFALLSVSVRVKAGSRLRVAIAGHDEAAFARVPAEGNPVLSIHRQKGRASWIDLPMKLRP